MFTLSALLIRFTNNVISFCEKQSKLRPFRINAALIAIITFKTIILFSHSKKVPLWFYILSQKNPSTHFYWSIFSIYTPGIVI